MKDIKGYNALVTGGTSGMGLEYCRQLAAKGCNVLMVSIQRELLETLPAELSKEYGVQAWGLYMDLAQDGAADTVWNYCRQQRLDIDTGTDIVKISKKNCTPMSHFGVLSRLIGEPVRKTNNKV